MAWSQGEVSELFLRASRARAQADEAQFSPRRLLRRAGAQRLLLDRCYLSTAASVASARADAAGYAAWSGASDHQLKAIPLAVSEAVTNSVRHAYPTGNGLIYLTATRIADELMVMVADDGVGPGHPPGSPETAAGWSIIADAADQFIVSARGGGGTLVEMRWAMVVAAVSGLAAPADLDVARERRARRGRR